MENQKAVLLSLTGN